MAYKDLLLDPRWQRKRLEIFNRDQFTCRYCKNSEQQLHVHHILYESDLPWETQDKYLITLCSDCHEKEESLKESDWYGLVQTSGITRLHFGKILISVDRYLSKIECKDVNSVDDFIKLINHG